jgi:hypothetical protein
MQHLCLIHSDAVQVDDALTKAAAAFACVGLGLASSGSGGGGAGVGGTVGSAPGGGGGGGDGAGAAAAAARVAAARASVRLALGHLTDAMVGTLTSACGEMWDTAPKGCWAGGGGGGGGGNGNGGGAGGGGGGERSATSAAAEMVSAQLLTPLHRSLIALDPRTAASVAPTAAAAAVQGLLTRVRSEGGVTRSFAWRPLVSPAYADQSRGFISYSSNRCSCLRGRPSPWVKGECGPAKGAPRGSPRTSSRSSPRRASTRSRR